MTVEEAGNLIARLAALYPRQELAPETLAGYVRYILDLDASEASDAVDEWVATERFFPTISEIREVAAMRRLNAPAPAEAWLQCHGGQAPKHPLALKALQAIGGQWAVRTSENPEFLRRDFVDTYTALVQSAVREQTVAPIVRAAALPEIEA